MTMTYNTYRLNSSYIILYSTIHYTHIQYFILLYTIHIYNTTIRMIKSLWMCCRVSLLRGIFSKLLRLSLRKSGACSTWDEVRRACCSTPCCRQWPSGHVWAGLASSSDSWAWSPTARRIWSWEHLRTRASIPWTPQGQGRTLPSSTFCPRMLFQSCRSRGETLFL